MFGSPNKNSYVFRKAFELQEAPIAESLILNFHVSSELCYLQTL